MGDGHPSPTVLDHAAAAAGEALREVAWDRERGIPHSTPDMLRKVAGAVMTVAEAYGVRSCRTCRHWERRGEEGWGRAASPQVRTGRSRHASPLSAPERN